MPNPTTYPKHYVVAQHFFDAWDYGAFGDSTDQTQALQQAIDAALSAGGGVVNLQEGIYVTGNLTLYSTVRLQGAGMGATTIKLKSGADPTLWMQAVNVSGLSVMDSNTNPVSLGASYVYQPPGWNAAWQAAKARASSGRAFVTAIGDSITAGQYATDIMVDSWYAKLRASILSANGNLLGGDHYSMLYTSQLGLSTATPPLTLSGTAGTDWDQFNCAFSQGCLGRTTTKTPLLSCTPPYAVTGFEILYMDYNAGSWNYNVDGGSNTTVTTTGPNTFQGCKIQKISITGLTKGTHTLNINTVGSNLYACVILGITAYVGTTGFCFANMGYMSQGLVSGTTATNALSETDSFPVDKLSLYQGYLGTTASPTALTGLGFPTQPDLAIIAFGVNDASQSVSRANFRDQLDRLVWALRYGKSDACSILLVAMWTADGTLASSTSVANMDFTSAVATPYRDIKAAMLEVAQANTCAFVDVHGAFGRTPITNGWIQSTSNLHPTNAGYTRIAKMLSAMV